MARPRGDGAATGAAYLTAKKAQRDRAAEFASRARETVAELYDDLATIAADAVRRSASELPVKGGPLAPRRRVPGRAVARAILSVSRSASGRGARAERIQCGHDRSLAAIHVRGRLARGRLMPKKLPPRDDRSVANALLDLPDSSVLDVLDHVLTKGVMATGDVTLGVAGVDLVYLRLSALLCATDRVMPEPRAKRPRRRAGRRRARSNR